MEYKIKYKKWNKRFVFTHNQSIFWNKKPMFHPLYSTLCFINYNMLSVMTLFFFFQTLIVLKEDKEKKKTYSKL